MTNAKLLIVDDDPGVTRFLTTFFNKQGFDTDYAETGAEMFKKLETNIFDCLIVDLGLPDEDGIVLVRKLRLRSEVPIIVLTGRDGLDAKLASFDAGADDYVSKPVDPRELLSRVNANLRRADSTDKDDQNIVRVGNVELNFTQRKVTLDDGSTVDLAPTEFSLLWLLANADGEVMSRDVLVDAVSKGDGPLTLRAIDIHISRVRKKLGKNIILTVPKSGYKCG